MGIAGGEPDCGRYLQQSQATHTHGSFSTVGTTLRFASDLARKNETTRRIARAVAGLIVREVSDIDSYIDLARYETRTLLTTHADTSASDKISFSH
jgi:hypothetical protein